MDDPLQPALQDRTAITIRVSLALCFDYEATVSLLARVSLVHHENY
jgi:hypothetical protein